MALSTLNLVFYLRRKRAVHDVTMPLSATSHTVPLYKSYYVAQSGETGIIPLETNTGLQYIFQARNSGKDIINYALFSSDPSICIVWLAHKSVICFCTQFPQIRILLCTLTVWRTDFFPPEVFRAKSSSRHVSISRDFLHLSDRPHSYRVPLYLHFRYLLFHPLNELYPSFSGL
jgi:hypothetical protein